MLTVSRLQNQEGIRQESIGEGGDKVLYSAGLELRGVFVGLMVINHSIGFVRMDFFPSLHLWIFFIGKRFFIFRLKLKSIQTFFAHIDLDQGCTLILVIRLPCFLLKCLPFLQWLTLIRLTGIL